MTYSLHNIYKLIITCVTNIEKSDNWNGPAALTPQHTANKESTCKQTQHKQIKKHPHQFLHLEAFRKSAATHNFSGDTKCDAHTRDTLFLVICGFVEVIEVSYPSVELENDLKCKFYCFCTSDSSGQRLYLFRLCVCTSVH